MLATVFFHQHKYETFCDKTFPEVIQTPNICFRNTKKLRSGKKQEEYKIANNNNKMLQNLIRLKNLPERSRVSSKLGMKIKIVNILAKLLKFSKRRL